MQRALLDEIQETVRRALAEDIGSGDLTAGLISTVTRINACVMTREEAVLCGQMWFDEVFHQIDAAIKVQWRMHDGDLIQAGQTICDLGGPARGILTGERTALNFLQLLSATATRTRQYVEAVRGTQAVILDTRKTLPGLRKTQKYAVVCGGGRNHRLGLYDGILVKENHIAAAGSISAALQAARYSAPKDIDVEIEVESISRLREALRAGADHLLLDNFSLEDLRSAVKETRGRARLEASGGITLANIRAVADCGVDYISVGDITKNLDAIDLSLRFSPGA
ncbi:MAG: carboxylating nicotinate-nucleotide diphosphorylase [Sulfuricaulis sp.]|uniref:carboxylating nicotinate-nucleotide diphosphorylase n=1 Tax=Sulfuricaulis sp. TaxID=2003553 RepID=UPI0034A277DD